MITEFRTLRPDDTLDQAVEYIRSGFRQDFPVVEDGRLVGILTRSDLAAALGRLVPGARVREFMRRDFVTLDRATCCRPAFARLQECDCHTLPVVQDGRLVGLVMADNLAEVFVIIQEAAKRAARGLVRSGRAASLCKNFPCDTSERLPLTVSTGTTRPESRRIIAGSTRFCRVDPRPPSARIFVL